MTTVMSSEGLDDPGAGIGHGKWASNGCTAPAAAGLMVCMGPPAPPKTDMIAVRT